MAIRRSGVARHVFIDIVVSLYNFLYHCECEASSASLN